ncbi:MAG: class I adenylate-forming enzyme family protein, partial [Paracoccaceae bacterium]|nr:class I adenylate-forming enzyme family protein [Paracoccaceae bacterium]
MNPADWLRRTSRLFPESPALFSGMHCVADYAGFNQRAASIGAFLASHHGVTKGDRIAVFMKNRTEYLEALYGIWYTGAAVIPINSKLHPREAAWIIENAQASIAFVSNDIAADLTDAGPECLKTVISAGSDQWVSMYDTAPLAEPATIDQDDMVWL